MPLLTKVYHTVDGEIIGETTSNARTDFLIDAVGSVVATVDQNANVVNSYRYKPYGELLTATGAGLDPMFRWKGANRYRSCPLSPVTDYLSFQHYSAITSSLTTPSTTTVASRYTQLAVGGNSTWPNTCDLSKIMPQPIDTYTSKKPVPGNCGEALPWWIKWMPSVQQRNGWIIQQMEISIDRYSCDTGAKYSRIYSYWEGWYVNDKGRVLAFWNPIKDITDWDLHDQWNMQPESCKRGSWNKVGHPTFYPSSIFCWPSWGWSPGNGAGDRGNLLGGPKPTGWRQSSRFRFEYSNYDCCKYTTISSPCGQSQVKTECGPDTVGSLFYFPH